MTDTKPLAGRTALVTGASKGIGAATAIALAKAGAHVILVARKVKALEAVEDQIGIVRRCVRQVVGEHRRGAFGRRRFRG